MDKKLFTEMSLDERKEWLAEFQPWYAEKLPIIESGKFSHKDFEQGLSLIAVFPFTRSFVREALRFRDYASRKRLLRNYSDKALSDAKAALAITVDLTDPALLVPHVGRPTKDEAAARALKAENDRKEAEAKEETLFGPKSEIPTIDAAAPGTVSGSLNGGTLLHLDQLKWLFSPELQEAVETVRDLRSRAEEAATTAKVLAEAGKPESEVEPYSQEAIKCTEAYEAIYVRVDNELAVVYVRLKEDTAFRASIEAQKVDPQQLRTTLRPYWDKVEDKDAFKAKVIEDIKANDPEQKALREAEEKKKEQVDAIVKYLMRKDKPNTPKRIETMTQRYQALVELIGEEEAKPYLAVLNAAKEDCEKNVVPAAEAQKAEKAAAKKAAKAEKKTAKKK